MSSSFNDFKSAVKLFVLNTGIHDLKNSPVDTDHFIQGFQGTKRELKRTESKYILDVVLFQ